ncbi:Fe(3+) dicitrate ABC transporter permease subunit FecD [Marinomonas rhizomae]|uniref:Iron complex transport system permease protein n=1 Tax=Marinomonas rhizomae TaxID=491948 RepID=A0A366J575_9GAMM|nr:Fe(3+) dicitrate ABC transporter permease subunit FecD [Marinomonas rhizomae]RBP81098.1 iron complex transport system permease protein [Marinomonas rhizomae]RNF72258.1 Fe(3+) dicitrate ABC transporter permease subunit FecD [Marinomonas rhizomae]
MATRSLPILLLTLLGLLLANLMFGAVSIPFKQILDGLQIGSEHYFTVHEYRLPRTILAMLVGAMMALAGALVQGVIRNPLASPDVLGVSHGAGLAAVFYMSFFPNADISWLPAVALVGSLMAALMLWWLCGQHSSTIKMAITGVALAALYASCIDFLMLVKPLEINNALLWLTGSLWGRGWNQLSMLLPWLLLMPFALWLAKPLNLIHLGDDSAISLGIKANKLRLASLAIAVGLTASCVAICGPIGFLGLVAPHLTRKLVGGRHQILLPSTMLVGAILLLLADLAARTIDPPIELPAGIMTAIIGAPYFLWLLLRTK